MNIAIRKELGEDYNDVRSLISLAFASSEFGHNGEAELVDSLRGIAESSLSLVACLENEIVGHILFTPIYVLVDDQRVEGMGLAPISVAPKWQNQGIGTKLINHGIELLFESGCRIIAVIGNERYYKRFGFRPANEFQICHGFTELQQEFLQVASSKPNELENLTGGKLFYSPEFGLQHEMRK